MVVGGAIGHAYAYLGRYYSLDRAREVLAYDPQDNSAEYTFGGEPKDGGEE